MLSVSGFIRDLECPVCSLKRLRVSGSVCGEDSFGVSLVCMGCGVRISSPLLPCPEEWTVHKDDEDTIEEDVFLWNQA